MRLAVFYTLFIFASLYFTPALRDFLVLHRLLENFVSGLYALLGLFGVALFFRKYRITDPVAYLLFSGLFVLFLLEFYNVNRLIERLHLLEYALMFTFWFRFFRHLVSPVLCCGATLVWGLAVAFLDEGTQYLLPNRYFELRDIHLNVTGMLFGMGVMMIFSRYRGDRKAASGFRIPGEFEVGQEVVEVSPGDKMKPL